MGEDGGKGRIQAVTCTVVIFHEERGIIIWGIYVRRYGKLTRADLDRALIFNGSIIAFTRQVDKI